MPQIINRDPKSSESKPAANQSAVVKDRRRSKDEPRNIPVTVIIASGALALVLVLFLFHTYVHPFTRQVREAHKVPPLPGMADVPPYNIKEWQDMYKSGKATFVSGMPRGVAAGPNGNGKP